MKLSSNFEEALIYATRVHGGQLRKKTRVPYIGHLLGVAAIAMGYGVGSSTKQRREFTRRKRAEKFRRQIQRRKRERKSSGANSGAGNVSGRVPEAIPAQETGAEEFRSQFLRRKRERKSSGGNSAQET